MSLPEEYFRPGLGLEPLESSWAISSIIAEILERAGIRPEQYDMSGLQGMCDGFSMTSDNAAYSGIKNLGDIFLFDASNFDGKLHFVPRGRPTVADITTEDTLADDDNAQTLTRHDSIDVPRVLTLEYYDVEGGLQPDMQTSDRSLDARSKSTSESETTVMMRADDAARVVVITHKVAIEEQRGEYKFKLPDSYIWLTTADCITIDGERIRLTKVSIDDGFQEYEAAFDRVSAYTSSVLGLPAAPVSDPPTQQVGDTTLHFIDIPIIRDGDDRLGYYVAISGTSAAWKGANVELSIDGGANFIASQGSGVRAIMGNLTEPLQDFGRPEASDNVNSTTVQLTRDVNDLTSATLAGMQNRSNLAVIGNEIVNFKDVDEVSPGVWELNGFLRGRKGTPVSAHAAGERFVMLQSSRLIFVPAELYLLNRQLTFRVTTFGANVSTTATFDFVGNSQRERQPSYLKAFRSGGNIEISWQGVGRLGGGVNVAMGAFFSNYLVTVNGTQYNLLERSLTIPDIAGAVTISVQQVNQITGAGPSTTVII